MKSRSHWAARTALALVLHVVRQVGVVVVVLRSGQEEAAQESDACVPNAPGARSETLLDSIPGLIIDFEANRIQSYFDVVKRPAP